jgi:DNA polymerase-3 subunit beta
VTLEGFPAEDWPRIAALDDTTLVARVRAGVLADAFGRVAICASTDGARPVLTSVAMFLDAKTSTMEVVATDSYRLGAVTIRPEVLDASVPSALLIPARAAVILAKQLRHQRGTVEIRIGAASEGTIPAIRFSFGDAVWSVRPIEGEFPNWRQLLPEFGTGASCEFDSAELASALKAMAAVRQNGSPVRLSLGERSSLVLAERDLGEVTEELAGARFNPDGVGALQIAFNPELLSGALRFCGGDRVRVWLRDGLKPALFGEPEARYLLMPVRIS